MEKRRIIIADTELDYIAPIQAKFAETFLNAEPGAVDLEIITNESFFREFMSVPEKADILIVSERLYNRSFSQQDFSYIFVMGSSPQTRWDEASGTYNLYKYSSINDIFDEIVSICPNVFSDVVTSKGPQIIVVTSACGGAGKTTVAMGICSYLEKNRARALYINAEHLHSFQKYLRNHAPISSNETYMRLMNADSGIHSEMERIIRHENFSYLPPFKAPLMSMGLSRDVYKLLAVSAKSSGKYDYIVLDTDSVFDENKAELFELADKVLIITKQDKHSVFTTNVLVSNINDIASGKYLVIFNDYRHEPRDQTINKMSGNLFTPSEYIYHFEDSEMICSDNMDAIEGISKTAYLVK